MREELKLPQIDKNKIEAVKSLIDNIAESINSDCSRELEELSRITGKTHQPMEFAEYWGWTDLDTIAETALMPQPPCMRDLTSDEVAEIVSLIRDYEISCEDAKAEYYMELLHRSLAIANVMSYIMSGDDVEAIADRMMKAASSSVIIL